VEDRIVAEAIRLVAERGLLSLAEMWQKQATSVVALVQLEMGLEAPGQLAAPTRHLRKGGAVPDAVGTEEVDTKF
jgi:hypothetical protein